MTDRYLISSITEIPNTSSQWELVARDGTILHLSYAAGELLLCEWVSAPESGGGDGVWHEVERRARDDLPVLQRLRDCHIDLREAIAMMGHRLAVTTYVASHELNDVGNADVASSV